MWNSSRTATSVEGVATHIGLSEIDSRIGHCAAGRVGPTGLSACIEHLEMPPEGRTDRRRRLIAKIEVFPESIRKDFV